MKTSDRFAYDEDEHMEARFQKAVEIAKETSRAKGKPVAGYDDERGEAYMEYPDGKRVYYPNVGGIGV